MYFKWNFFYQRRLWKDLQCLHYWSNFPLSHTGMEQVNRNKAFFFSQILSLSIYRKYCQFIENSGITLGKEQETDLQRAIFQKKGKEGDTSDIWSWISVNFSEEILVTIKGTRKRWPESNGFPYDTPKPDKGLTVQRWGRHSWNSNSLGLKQPSWKKIQVFPKRCKD